MEKGPALAALLAGLLAVAVPSQRLALSVNEAPLGTAGGSLDGSIFAFKWLIPRPMLIAAAEFWVGTTTGTCEIHLFAHDAVNDRPGSLLASGRFPAPAVVCWAGTPLDRPVNISQANTILWLGLAARGAIIPATGRSGTAPPYFFTSSVSSPISWTGPLGPPKQATGWDWMYRIYERGGQGSQTLYGKGKLGTYGIPILEPWGWPNLGNPVSLAAATLMDASAGVLVMGPRSSIPLPLGSIYVAPPLSLAVFATAAAPMRMAQSWLFNLAVPNDPGLLSLSVAAQLWMVDPGATMGLCHSCGVEFTIG